MANEASRLSGVMSLTDIRHRGVSRKEYQLQLNVLSLANLQWTREDPGNFWEGLVCDCNADGVWAGRSRPVTISSATSINISHIFSSTCSAKTKVLVSVSAKGPDGMVNLGQASLAVGELELGKQELRTAPLRKRNKKEIVNADVMLMANLSKNRQITGPSQVTKPVRDGDYLSGIGGSMTATGTGAATTILTPTATTSTTPKRRKDKALRASGNVTLKKSLSLKFRKNIRKSSAFKGRPGFLFFYYSPPPPLSLSSFFLLFFFFFFVFEVLEREHLLFFFSLLFFSSFFLFFFSPFKQS